jgi:hypothetical protein
VAVTTSWPFIDVANVCYGPTPNTPTSAAMAPTLTWARIRIGINSSPRVPYALETSVYPWRKKSYPPVIHERVVVDMLGDDDHAKTRGCTGYVIF